MMLTRRGRFETAPYRAVYLMNLENLWDLQKHSPTR